MAAAYSPTILSGPQAVTAANELRKRMQAREEWPFPWFAPPVGSQHCFKHASIQAPATGTLTEILAYTVEDGSQFCMSDILLTASGPTWTPGDGTVTFTVDIDKPVGVTSPGGLPFKDFASVQIPLGSFACPWPVRPGEESIVKARHTIRAKVTTTAPIPVGGNNFFTACFIGWTWPVK